MFNPFSIVGCWIDNNIDLHPWAFLILAVFLFLVISLGGALLIVCVLG